jgi:hypothetical protein
MNRYDLTNFLWKLNAKLNPDCLLRMGRLCHRFPRTNWSTQVVNRTRAQAEAHRTAILAALMAKGWRQDPQALDNCLVMDRAGRRAWLSVESIVPCYEGFQFEVTPFIAVKRDVAA